MNLSNEGIALKQTQLEKNGVNKRKFFIKVKLLYFTDRAVPRVRRNFSNNKNDVKIKKENSNNKKS